MAPLPPLPPESTRRVYIVYTSGGEEHTMSIRIPPGVSGGTLDDYLNEVITAMLPLMSTADTVIRVDDSAAGSNIRFPLFPVGLAGTGGTPTINDQTKSAFMSMTGKGSDGRLVSVSFYYPDAANFADTRVALGVLGTAQTDWYNAVGFSSTGLSPRTIGGASPTWNAYVNIARSAYWQREFR